MKVVHWYSNLLGGGGVASAVTSLAAAQARSGARVTVITAAPLGVTLYDAFAPVSGMDVIVWQPGRTVDIAGYPIRVPLSADVAAFRALRPDVVHVHGEFVADNLWAPRLFDAPAVISPHGALHRTILAKSRRLSKRAYLSVRKCVHRRADAFHALSPVERDEIAALFPKATIYCVPQGPNERVRASVTGAAGEAAPRRSLGEGCVDLIYVGRLDVYTKGLDILISAFAASIRALGGGLRLTLVGPDWRGGRSWLEQRVREVGVGAHVRFTGPLSGSEVAAMLAASDIYVQLSRSDAFGLSVAEALLAGKPTILSHAVGIGSFPEIASLSHVRRVPASGEAAADAMIAFARNCRELGLVARASVTAVERFLSWDGVAQHHLTMYDDLIHAAWVRQAS